MKTRLKRLLVFAIPIVLAIALMSGLSAGAEEEDTNEDIDFGDHGEFIGIDSDDDSNSEDLDFGDHGDFIGIDSEGSSET